MKHARLLHGLAALVLLTMAQTAGAHSLDGLHNALAHPFLGADLMVAMLAIGCLLFARAQDRLVRAGGAGVAGAGLLLLIAV